MSARDPSAPGLPLAGGGGGGGAITLTGDTTGTGTGTIATTTSDLTIASEARGDILRRGASAWERVAAKTAGNVVAGDGTDAVSVAIATPLAVAPAANRVALGLSIAPLDDPGAWTLDAGVTVAAATLTATLTSGGGAARLLGAYDYTMRRTGVELVARLVFVSAPSPTNAWAEVGLNNAGRDGFHFQLRGDGALQACKMPGFSGPTASGDPAGTWVRAIVTSASTADAYYSTAVARPTTEAGWLYMGEMTGIPTDIGNTLHAGLASNAAVDAVATVTGLTLRGWPL